MAGNPDVFALLEEMLDSGRTPEEVCRDCPELLPEVRRRWQAFRLIDGTVAALLPDPETPSGCRRDRGRDPYPPTCRRSPATGWRRCSAAAAWASSTGPGTCASTAPSP